MTNRESIFKLVEENFSLNDNSLNKFKQVLFNKEERLKYIPEDVHPHLDENFRIRKKLPRNLKPKMDNGWGEFKTVFRSFLAYSGVEVSYLDFSRNKIRINKNEYRLFKYIKSWYKNEDNRTMVQELLNFVGRYIDEGISEEELYNELDMAFKVITESIGVHKIPERDLEIVVSYNFEDWFLSATEESWTSCLNLESNFSRCFWTGLPGTIIDKNRALIYVTDGRQKFYHYSDSSIKAERIITRSWLIYTDKDEYLPVRFYPSNFLQEAAFNDIFPINIREGVELHEEIIDYITKYPIDLLSNKLNESVYIYIDKGSFVNKDNEVYISSSNMSGMKTMLFMDKNINDRLMQPATFYNFEGGLSLLSSGYTEIINYHRRFELEEEFEDSYEINDILYCDSVSIPKVDYPKHMTPESEYNSSTTLSMDISQLNSFLSFFQND